MGKQRKPLLMLLKLVKLLKPLLLLLRKLVLKLNKMLPKLKLLARVLNKMLPLLLLHVKLPVKLVNLLLKQERQLVKLDNKLKPLGLLVKELLLLPRLLLMKPLEDFLKLKLTCKKSNPNLVNRLELCGGSIENCTSKRNISLPAEEAFPNKRLDHLSYG